MKKVSVLLLLMTLNIGAVAQELIFQDGFESGWPNAWAEAVGWSPLFVKDSTGKVVGPVIDWTDEEQVPIVAIWIDGEKVLFRVRKERLFLKKNVYFTGENCLGQAYVCYWNCVYQSGGAGSPTEDMYTASVELVEVAYGIGENGVLYRGYPPDESEVVWQTFVDDRVTAPWRSCDTINPGNYVDLGRAYPAQPVVDLNTLFTPPFTVE